MPVIDSASARDQPTPIFTQGGSRESLCLCVDMLGRATSNSDCCMQVAFDVKGRVSSAHLWPGGRHRCPAAAGALGQPMPRLPVRWACWHTGAAPAAGRNALLWRCMLHPPASRTCIEFISLAMLPITLSSLNGSASRACKSRPSAWPERQRMLQVVQALCRQPMLGPLSSQ